MKISIRSENTNGGNHPENNEGSFNRIYCREHHRVTVSDSFIKLLTCDTNFIVSTCSKTLWHRQKCLKHHPDLEILSQFINSDPKPRKVNETSAEIKVKALISFIGLANFKQTLNPRKTNEKKEKVCGCWHQLRSVSSP